MSITYCNSCYTDELFGVYPFLDDVEIYTVDWYDLPYGVLAATNGKDKVFVRKDLPLDLFRHSLFHEFEHILDPYASEFEIEKRARRKSGYGNYIA